MAKPKSKRTTDQPESKRALVIFLVFFILTTIGAGLFGYQGYIDSEGKDAKIKDATNKAAEADKEVLFWKFQALKYRTYLGQEKHKDLANLQRQWDEGTEAWVNNKERDEAKNSIAAINANLNKIAPGLLSYERGIEIKTQEVADARKAIAPHDAAKGAGDKRADDLKAELENGKTDFKTNVEKVAKTFEKNQAEEATAKTLLEKKLNDMSAAYEKANTQLEVAKIETQKALAAERKKITDRDRQIESLQANIAKLQSISTDVEVPELQSKVIGKVIDRKGDSVFINLGSIQKMVPQTTFSVHGVGADGTAMPAIKGSVTVTNVFDSGSQTRITFEKSKSDQIQVGDVLVNPNWNPDRKRHIAIAGLVDLTGEGTNQLREFRQMLERQGIVVDAYLESAGPNWVQTGKVSRETNYLVLGAEADKGPKLEETELVKQARLNGILRMSLRNYLDLIGYQPPHSQADFSDSRPIATPPPADKPPAKDMGAMPPK